MADDFRRGFASTFGQGLQIGASAAQTQLQERIKKQQEKAEKETRRATGLSDFNTLKEAISAIDPVLASQISQLDPTDMGIENVETINKSLSKRISDSESKKSLAEQIQEVQSMGSGTQTSQNQTARTTNEPEDDASFIDRISSITGIDSQTSKPQNDTPIVTGATINGVKVAFPEGVRKEAGERAEAEIDKQVEAQERKFSATQKRNLRTLQGQLIQSAIILKESQDITEKLTTFKPGRLAGFANIALGASGANPKIAEFKGDLAETVTSIAKIAAPSARVGPDLIKHFAQTMPDLFSNEPETMGQFTSSLSNALLKYAATNPEEFPDGLTFEQVTKFRDVAKETFEEIFKQAGSPVPKTDSQKELDEINSRLSELGG